MQIIYLLLALSLIMALLFLGLFFWSVGRKQFDDTVTPAHRILFEPEPQDREIPSKSAESNKPEQAGGEPTNPPPKSTGSPPPHQPS